jgi:signal transduction histidine kinase
MISAPITEDENERIKALYGYDILDTEAEKVFDDLTQLASEICETPIALISLVDPDRQWFKSTVGINAKETHRDIAFCAHAIHQREIFEVTNALKDERFFDNPLVTEDPNIRFYAGAQLVTPEGHAIGTLCAISDEPKKLNAHQRKALEILSREVIAQMELRRNLRDLKSANEYKTEFLSNISHEIRTPLNAITGFSRLLLEQSQEQNELTSALRDYVNEIEFSSKRLLHIVNSVLDLSKIEAGKMELKPTWIDIHQFLNDLNGMLQVKAKEKAVNLQLIVSTELPKHLFFDEGKLGQILINIINNAIKFTGKGKSITVNVSKTENNEVTFDVIDQGVGISVCDQSKLFNKYQQVGENRAKEGTGLGLCITKSLVELMQGTISLASEQNKGTHVHIALPLSDEQPEEMIEDKLIEYCQITPLDILIVEDNAINRKLAKLMFESMGQKITFAEDGESSVDLCRQHVFDAIFMDIHMPGINGIEAAKQIRQQGVKTPIIALTADIFEVQKRDENGFEFDEYLSKPIIKETLERVISKLSCTP